MKKFILLSFIVAGFISTSAIAQQVIYPEKGQSAQQQQNFQRAYGANFEGRGYTVK